MKGSEHRNKALWSLCEVVRAEVSGLFETSSGVWGADEERTCWRRKLVCLLFERSDMERRFLHVAEAVLHLAFESNSGSHSQSPEELRPAN